MKLLIKGGHVVDTLNKVNEKMDVLIENGIVSQLGMALNADGAEIIDANGMLVMPGFVDAHCHLREPGFEYKEDIETGTRSAAAGGFTSIACMPNTNPVIDNKAIVSYIKERASKVGMVNVFPIGAISKGQKGEELAEIGELKQAGAVAISDDGKPVKSNSLMKKALQYAAMLDVPVISHCEDMDLADEGVMNEGYNSTIMGLKGIPTAAEDVMVSRELILAEYLGLPVHIAHVSTELSIDLIRKAKKRGVKVTAETCPHYFSLTDDACLGFNTLAKVNPPLRIQKDVDAVIEGLKDGTLDMIATDHAPHHKDEKNVEFNIAANGLVGFETAFALGITHLVKPRHLTIEQLVNVMSVNPSTLLKIGRGNLGIGAIADLVIADIDEQWTVEPEKLLSKSKNTPYGGQMLTGKVKKTIVGGKVCVL